MKINGVTKICGLALAASLLAPFPLLAADEDAVPERTLSEFTAGETVSGEEVAFDKLGGKVVAIEYWGTR